MRVIPVEKNKTRLEHEIFAKGLEESKIEEFIKFLKVEREADALLVHRSRQDYDLCEAYQKNLSAGVYLAGAIQPEKENGTFYESLVRKQALAHLALEKAKGKKVNPAYAGLKSASRGNGNVDSISQMLEMERVCCGLAKGCESDDDCGIVRIAEVQNECMQLFLCSTT